MTFEHWKRSRECMGVPCVYMRGGYHSLIFHPSHITSIICTLNRTRTRTRAADLEYWAEYHCTTPPLDDNKCQDFTGLTMCRFSRYVQRWIHIEGSDPTVESVSNNPYTDISDHMGAMRVPGPGLNKQHMSTFHVAHLQVVVVGSELFAFWLQ